MRWFFVFFGMLLLGVAGVLLLRSRIDEPSPADEYAIISDIIEEGDEESEHDGEEGEDHNEFGHGSIDDLGEEYH